MRTLGICFGSTTMQCILADFHNKKFNVENTFRIAHEGNPRKALIDFLSKIDRTTVDRIAVTGRAFRNHVDLSSISEPESIEHALRMTFSGNRFPGMVISSGGEAQLVYTINNYGGISAVHSGNKCASGTGEFFLQQIRRMGLTLDQAVAMASRGVAHKIAGRCSVFCKSDCTHALNKGEARENIAAGLCLMMADKINDLIKDLQCDHMIIIGGGSKNHAMIDILRSRFPRLEIPAQADCFEAFGAAIWASEHHCKSLPLDLEKVITGNHNSFGVHQPLHNSIHLVDFKESRRAAVLSGDDCILGLDVGSTTTKAVLMRRCDSLILASIYLRTNGDPVQASINCYKALREQIGAVDISISGLGVTGSGRQIAGLHALTDNIINEIIAHATAATWFDKDVDTIFEIGGQDAKFTLLTGGIPSDYAMNEACSAGTGSFLEESAKESLNVATEEIGTLALQGNNPPNFTDQCSAFISSDIKIAGQEGIERNDILAGLVYSICLNYLNRVKGARPTGKKIFMQGGVCYNKAVPVAMAALIKSQIVVPPDPGLMGAYGVALEVNNRISLGITPAVQFHLDELIERDATKESSFVCNGGKEKCDRKCEIARIRIAGKVYPFGGICNKYYNLRVNREVSTDEFDLVAIRQKLLFEKYGVPSDMAKPDKSNVRTVGILRSFLTHSFYPLYSNFFDQLGCKVILSDEIDPDGISRIEAAFCLPAEISHGSFFNLIKKKPDFIFLPQVAQIAVPNVDTYSKTCVFVQGEPYYLKSTFRKELEKSSIVVLSPVLRMDRGYEAEEHKMVEMARKMGVGNRKIRKAYRYACKKQRGFESEILEHGQKALTYLDNHKDTFGIVLFGRPYSAFTGDANMGIPHKVASRGYVIIPHDMLPVAQYAVHHKMFWGMGQKIMKSAQFVKDHDNLFGFYITNFSCGPDSFLIGYFRRHMQEKPSLTLELDQHTADAGIDTRIEAAIDIITRYQKLTKPQATVTDFIQSKVITVGKELRVVSSDGIEYPLSHPDVEVVIPSMGRYGAESAAAVFRGMGINARALPIADKDVLLEGRKNTTCKECLPYILTTGSYLKYLNARTDTKKVTVFFMATGGGPCRLGQYCTTLEHLVERKQIRNAAVLPMTDENGYGGMGSGTLLKGWQAILISDIVNDIRSTLSVAAKDKKSALEEVEAVWNEIISFFEGRLSVRLSSLLATCARRLSKIPLKKDLTKVPVVSLIGEIYVRRDEFSRKNIVDYLESHGFAVRIAPIAEYMCYSNFVVNSGLGERVFLLKDQLRMQLTARVQEWWERRIKLILAKSKLYKFEMIEVDKTVRDISHLVNENFRGEAILTIGLGLREILHDSCGVISIGPFGCMPSRVAESILKKEMNVEGKRRLPGWQKKVEMYADIENFPFLSIETDGSPFPQLIEANLEAFILQARRVHERLVDLHIHKQSKKKNNYSIKWYDVVVGNRRVQHETSLKSS